MIETLALIRAAARKAVQEEIAGTVKFFKGDQGEKGERGERGESIRGEKGDSIRGPKGDPGRALKSVTVAPSGEMIVRMDDGEEITAGVVKGADGKRGERGLSIRGDDGRGVVSARIDDAGDLIVTYSDGTTANAGRARGEQGERGPRGGRGPSGSGGGSEGAGTVLTAGTAALDFGVLPGGGVAETIVTGQAEIGTGAKVRVWLQGDETADFNAYEHSRVFPSRIGLVATDIVAGVGFTIIAETELRLAGVVQCRWEWSA
jgi:hypothetical protein